MQVFVLGMHRSGTSTVARILNMMGFYFGPEGIALDPASDNEKGFWERRDVKEINDDLLKVNGTSWHAISKFKIDEISEDSANEFLSKARTIVNGMDANRPWMIKDPRNCLTFSLWRETLEFPICIHVIRNPYEIALSLQKRNGFPINFSLALWEKYQLEALKASRETRKVIVNYNELMANPHQVVKKMFDGLVQFGLTGLRMPGEKELDAFIKNDLYHHKKTNTDLQDILTPTQLRIWSLLENNEIAHDAYEKFFQSENSVLSAYEAFFKNEQDLNNFKKEILKKDELIKHLSLRIVENEKSLTALKNEQINSIEKFQKEKEELLLKKGEGVGREIENYHEKLKSIISSGDQETIEEIKNVKKQILDLDNKLENYKQILSQDAALFKNHFLEESQKLTDLKEEILSKREHGIKEFQKALIDKGILESRYQNLAEKVQILITDLKYRDEGFKDIELEFKNALGKLKRLQKEQLENARYSIELLNLSLASWRWKIGNFLVRTIERIILRKKPKLALDHLQKNLSKNLEALEIFNHEINKLGQKVDQQGRLRANHTPEKFFREDFTVGTAPILPDHDLNSSKAKSFSGINVDTKSVTTELLFVGRSKLDKKLTVNIISPTTNIHGGTKRLLMIAKLLHSRGHHVNFLRQYPSRKLDWFDLGIPIIDVFFNEKSSLEEIEKKFPDADVLITYGNNKANKLLDKLSSSKGRKFQLFMHFGIHDKGLDVQNAQLKNFRNLCTTSWIKEQLGEVTKHPAGTIGFGVHNDQFFPTRSKRPMRIGTLYHKSSWKRTRDVLLAYKKILSNTEFKNLKLVLYGQDPKPDLMGIESEYFFDPSQEEIREIYSSCAVWITPSLFEGIGMCSVEAMLCKTPLITVDTGGSKDFCNSENSLIVPKKSPEAIANAVIWALKNPEQAAKMAERAYRDICQHSWSRSIDLLEMEIGQVHIQSLGLRKKEGSVSVSDIVLTIGIPIHNQLDYVKNCIDSVKRNTFYKYEIILVDDCSDKETQAYLKNIDGRNIFYIRNKEQRGFPNNCNTILRYAKGEYVCLLNSDTIVTKNWDLYLINPLKNNDRLAMTGPSTSYGIAKNYDSVAQQLDEVHFRRFAMDYKEIQDFGEKIKKRESDQWNLVEYLNGFCMMLKAQIISDVGFFDTAFGLGSREEVQYIDRIKEEGFEVAWVKGAYVHHFGHQSFASIEDSKALWEKNKALYFATKGLKRHVGITKKRIGFVYNAKNSSSTRKRTFEPISVLNRFLEIDTITINELNENFLHNHQIIVLQRIGGLNEKIDEKNAKQLFEWIRVFKLKGHIFIYDLDDLVIHAQNNLPLKLIRECDYVSVSTEVLSNFIKQFNPNTVVLPNGVDVSAFEKAEPEISDGRTVKVVCFSLAGAGAKEFDHLAKLVREDLSKDFEFHFFSGERLEKDKFKYITLHKNVPLKEYFGWLKSADFSINWDSHSLSYFEKLRRIYDLKKEEEELFVDGKSGLKYYNSALSRTVFLTTSRPKVYSELVDNEINGFIIDGPEQARDVLVRLTSNPSLKNDVIENAFEDVFSNFALENTAKFYLEFFSKL